MFSNVCVLFSPSRKVLSKEKLFCCECDVLCHANKLNKRPEPNVLLYASREINALPLTVSIHSFCSSKCFEMILFYFGTQLTTPERGHRASD